MKEIISRLLPIVVIAGVGFWVYRKFMKASVSNYKPIVLNPLQKPLTAIQAKKYSNDLLSCMADLGTWNFDLMDEIYNKLRDKRGALSQVYNAFGHEKYYLYGSPSSIGMPFLGDSIDLIEWFRRELSGIRLNNWLTLAEKEGIL